MQLLSKPGHPGNCHVYREWCLCRLQLFKKFGNPRRCDWNRRGHLWWLQFLDEPENPPGCDNHWKARLHWLQLFDKIGHPFLSDGNRRGGICELQLKCPHHGCTAPLCARAESQSRRHPPGAPSHRLERRRHDQGGSQQRQVQAGWPDRHQPGGASRRSRWVHPATCPEGQDVLSLRASCRMYSTTPAGCTAGLMSSLSIPESVMSIGRNAFAGCRSLTSLDIPNGVTEIRDGTFDGCSSLMTLSIPTSVAQIGQGAFVGCSSLTTLTIPESVTCIKDSAFDSCSSLRILTFLPGLMSIGNYAFAGCSSLTRLDIPHSVTEIGGGAFDGCSSLTSLTIPETVRKIGPCAFHGCISLTNLQLPRSFGAAGAVQNDGCDVSFPAKRRRTWWFSSTKVEDAAWEWVASRSPKVAWLLWHSMAHDGILFVALSWNVWSSVRLQFLPWKMLVDKFMWQIFGKYLGFQTLKHILYPMPNKISFQAALGEPLLKPVAIQIVFNKMRIFLSQVVQWMSETFADQEIGTEFHTPQYGR